MQSKRVKQTPAGMSPNILAAISLVALMLIGGYWHVVGSPFQFALKPGAITVSDDALTDRLVNKHFNMSGVRLGMTSNMMLNLHPTAKTSQGREGEPVLTLPTNRGLLVAWFDESKEVTLINGKPFAIKPERIYRLRLDEAYTDLSEQTLINNYARIYGRPIEAKCNRNRMGDTPRCTYRWWGGDGIELVAIVKRKVDANGQNYVLLTTIATNTLKTSKLATTLHKEAHAATRG